VRPGCPAPARASLTFRYESREAWIERLTEEPTPEAYDLCSSHAARTQPPHGWQLRDRRPREEQLPQPEAPARRELGGEDTVAVLAAALRAVPESTEAADAAGPPTGAADVEQHGPASPQVAAGAGDTEDVPEEAASPVLGSPGVPRLLARPEDPVVEDEPGREVGLGDEESDEDASGARSTAARAATPRPVPAARARGIAPPANRSVQAPHGTALDW
jgi:hypothetical protein